MLEATDDPRLEIIDYTKAGQNKSALVTHFSRTYLEVFSL
jgi:hypothetical protein